MKLRELNETIKKNQEIYSKFSGLIKEPNYQKLKDNSLLLEEIKKNTTKNILRELYSSNFKHAIAPQIKEMMKKSIEAKEKLQETVKALQDEIEKVIKLFYFIHSKNSPKFKMEGSIKEFLEIHRHYKTTIKKTENEIAFKNDQLQKVFNIFHIPEKAISILSLGHPKIR